MATKLQVYNGVLRKLGEPRLVALTDEGKSRRAIDGVWDEAIDYCLEQGQWNFAMRTVKVDATPSVDTEFGYAYVFDKPDDWIRTSAVSTDEYFGTPHLRYDDRTDWWLADVDLLYFKFVSNDAEYGGDMGRWPATFSQYVQFHMAMEICELVTGGLTKMDDLRKSAIRAKRDALNKDAMNDAVTRFPPTGRLVSARGGSRSREGRYRAG